MAEALKNMYNREFILHFGERVHSVYGSFDVQEFLANIINETWDELKLKERMRRITETLGGSLPEIYEEALKILFAIDESCVGFPYLFFPDFVALYGQEEEDWELSMKALERFTIRSSSEFAVRTFIIRDPKKMMDQMLVWSKSSNEHVRRLASEGCRPRLPWGEALTVFKNDPTLVISVLEQLKNDISIYVRRSVANNLNDISKDNPMAVLEIIRRWKGVQSQTDWILRHGARTLIRKANPAVMELFGYGDNDDRVLTSSDNLSVNTPEVNIGDSSSISYEVCIREGEPVHVRIEYGIYFVKARENTSRKLFFLCDKTLSGGEHFVGTKQYRWKDLTTRRHYPGEHRITLLVNGKEVAQTVINVTRNNIRVKSHGIKRS